jgi:hypothetical protein
VSTFSAPKPRGLLSEASLSLVSGDVAVAGGGIAGARYVSRSYPRIVESLDVAA